MTREELVTALREERLSNYVKLSGGFSIPLAGVVYWLWLAALGTQATLPQWINIACWTSGLIFPLALLFARVFRNNFMKEKGAVDSVLLPAFIGMLLFWPMLFAATRAGADSASLILAIGMSIHWPVIGWMYGRTGLYSAHSILRAAATTFLWYAFPEERLVYIPLAVAAAYAVTIVAILIDVSVLRAKRNK